MLLTKFCTVAFLSSFMTNICANTYDDHKRLYKELRKKMDPGIRPITNQSKPLEIYLLPSLAQIQGLQEKPQLLFSTIVLQFTWTMDTMKWDPKHFGGTTYVNLSPKESWFPDVVYKNTINNLFDMKNGDRMKITVTANGNSTWITGDNLISHCKVDITDYPFDTQVCKVELGKMFSYDYEMMIIPKTDKLDLTYYKENDEWQLTGTAVRYLKVRDHMHYVELEVTVKRRPLFYLFNIILPICLLSLMNVFCFKLPTSSGERIAYCISLLLTFCVFLANVGDTIPKVSQTVYLQLYASIQLTVGMVTTTISIYLMNFATYKSSENVPRWVAVLYYRSCRKPIKRIDVNGLEHRTTIQVKPDDGTAENKPTLMEDRTILDVNAAVRFMDDMFFWLFLCVFIATSLVSFLCMIF